VAPFQRRNRRVNRRGMGALPMAPALEASDR
jgi:hypothetical protein